MLGSIYKLADPLLNHHQTLASKSERKAKNVDGLFLVGMGGSASAGDVLADWLGSRFDFPITVSRSPRLPKSVSRNSRVVFLSYSGETWETLDAFGGALRIGCPVVGVGSGGRLKDSVERNGFPFFQVSPGLAPRAALGEMIVAGSSAVQSHGVTRSLESELREAGRELAVSSKKLVPDVPAARNRAKRLAISLLDKLPVVYAFPGMASVARRFKNQLAENAKVVSKYGLLPEACHNEIESFTDKRCAAIIIREWNEESMESRVLQAFMSTLKSASGLSPIQIRERSRSRLGGLLRPILLLDFASAYLAVLRGVDPSPTKRIAEYKRRYAREVG